MGKTVELVPVKILVENFSPYVKDDIAGFPPEEAKKIVEGGFGEAVKVDPKASAQKSE